MGKPTMYHVYILRSASDGTHYYGSTKDIASRLREHNAGKVRSTKGHRPYTLIYSEEYPSRAEACQRERFFKSIEGYRWLKTRNIL